MQGIIQQTGCNGLSFRCKNHLLGQCLAYALRYATVNLALSQHWIYYSAAVVYPNVPEDANLPGIPAYLHHHNMGGKRVG